MVFSVALFFFFRCADREHKRQVNKQKKMVNLMFY
jgi:hypothetical protein